ncbi:MAG: bifunctional riboflavin kinase/FAD synthetase [Candidatus Izimaplasma sp.]|nr:bifunctional riboflavin kinase/FAD synthetase [Candidatus Izimaplasma bacterium]
MEIIYLNGTKVKKDSIAAIGFFDGVHKAHQKLLNETIDIARTLNKEAAVITFDIHPKSVLFDLDYHYITPLKQKLAILKSFNFDTIYIIEFTKKIANMDPKRFINTYLNDIHTLVCGFDFKFGARASGTVKTLKDAKLFDLKVIEEIRFDGYKIGSTHLRDLINAGHVAEIKPILGRYYAIKGEVIHGEKKGRMIGYPTANIDYDNYIVPKKGVYATYTIVDGKKYQSMSSIGHNPTLNCQVDLSVESNIFEFDEEIYGETVEIQFVKRLRDELKFDTVDDLIETIDQDKVNTLNILK